MGTSSTSCHIMLEKGKGKFEQKHLKISCHFECGFLDLGVQLVAAGP